MIVDIKNKQRKSNIVVLKRVCPKCMNKKPLSEFPLEQPPPEICIECQGRAKEFEPDEPA